MDEARETIRFFKTRWFAKRAKKAHIGDDELCAAVAEVIEGQADDLGGGVFKKRLNKNMHRSIVLMRGNGYLVYAYLFAKNDRENIDDDELEQFRALADVYAAKSQEDITKELTARHLVEICHEQKNQIQERRPRGHP